MHCEDDSTRAEVYDRARRDPRREFHGSRSDRVIVFAHDGIWRVTWENGCDVLTTHVEIDAWRQAKRVAESERAEALLFSRNGEVRLRADFRVDPSDALG